MIPGEEAVQRLIPKANYETVGTEKGGAMRVLKGAADAFVYDLPFNAVFITMHPSDRQIFMDRPFTKEPVVWAIRKNDPDFLKFLNSFLEDIKEGGRFDKIYNKWFVSTDWFKHAK